MNERRRGAVLLSRRRFVGMVAVVSGGLLAACQQASAPTPAKPAETKPAAPAQSAPAAPAASKPVETKPAGAAKPAESKPAASAAPSGTLTIAQGVEPDTLDGQQTASAAVYGITLSMSDTLLTRDKTGKLQPGLATSYKSIDDKTWEVKLREGVTFHNGEPFTGEAVKYSFGRVLDPALKSVHASALSVLAGVEVVDPHTVRIMTKAPDPSLPGRLSMQYGQMLPPKYAAEVGPEGFAKKPIGAGPFKFVSWVKDDAVTLEAVPGHWRQPRAKTVIFKPVPEGAARVAGIKTGAVDLATAIPPIDFESIKNGERTTGIEVTSNRSYLMNLDTINFEPFKDKRVRQALNYAVDVESIIKNTLNGYGRAIATSVVPEAFAYDASIKPYPHDPDKAKALLAEAGYANGFEVGLDTTDGRYPQDKEIATVLAGQLEKVGIRVKVQTFEWGSFYQGVQAKKRAPIHNIGMSTELFDPDNTFSTHFHSERGKIWARWHNEEFNRLADIGRSTLDEAKRKEALMQAQKIQHDEAPMIFLHQITYLYGLNKRVSGWEPTNMEPLLIWSAAVS